MKKKYFFSLLIASAMMYSCTNDFTHQEEILEQTIPQKTNSINQKGNLQGLGYSFENLAVNSGLLTVNAEDASLVSVDDRLIKLNLKSDRLNFQVGNTCIVRIGEYNAIIKVTEVLNDPGSDVTLKYETGSLGDVFQEGKIKLSLDLTEAAKNVETRGAYQYKNGFNLLDMNGLYDLGNGLNYNPSTNVNMALNIEIAFSSSQILPTQIKVVFELNSKVNPLLSFSGNYNQIFESEFSEYLPKQVLDYIKTLEYDMDIPINVLGIKSIPAKIKIKDIQMPTTIEANVSNDSAFGYSVNGVFKLGYTIDIKGLSTKINPIYENTLTPFSPSMTNLHGEVLTQTDIIVIPDVQLFDSSFKVDGKLKISLKTISNGNVELPGKAVVFGSKGDFTASMDMNADLILTNIPINIYSDSKELWNVGTIDKTITFSDLQWGISSNYSTNLLNGTRGYTTNFSVNYKYPIRGKKISDKLFISYEVYEENGTKLIERVSNKEIYSGNVTNNSFSFSLNVPFKKKSLFAYQATSYIKNVIIRDNDGRVYTGILNSGSGVVENSFKLKR